MDAAAIHFSEGILCPLTNTMRPDEGCCRRCSYLIEFHGHTRASGHHQRVSVVAIDIAIETSGTLSCPCSNQTIDEDYWYASRYVRVGFAAWVEWSIGKGERREEAFRRSSLWIQKAIQWAKFCIILTTDTDLHLTKVPDHHYSTGYIQSHCTTLPTLSTTPSDIHQLYAYLNKNLSFYLSSPEIDGSTALSYRQWQ